MSHQQQDEIKSTSNHDDIESHVASASQHRLGQDTPLLTGTTRSSVVSNGHSVHSTGQNVFGFSSLWMDTATLNQKETFQNDRQRATEKGIVEAAFLIRDALQGEEENPSRGTYDPYHNPDQSIRNMLSLVFRRILSIRLLRQALIGVAWVLALLTFIEPPRWCTRGTDDAIAHMDCHQLFQLKGPPAGSNNITQSESVEYYPASHAILLSKQQSNIIEYMCTAFISLFIICEIIRDGCSLRIFFRRGPVQILRILQVVSISILLFGLLSGHNVLQPFARLALLMTFVRIVHEEIATLMKVLPEILKILFIMLIYMLFWAFLGTVLFYDTQEGSESFSNFIESLWTLWICVTTANYPDVMMPAYNESRLTALYFVVFMIMCFFFLMNLILASVVNIYDDEFENRKKKLKANEDLKLSQAFRRMDQDGSGVIDKDTVMTLFKVLNQDFPELREISQRDAELFYALLDRNGNSTISEEEFLDFRSISLLEFFTQDQYVTFIQLNFPTYYQSPGYQKFVQFVNSGKFDFMIDLILILNAVVVTIQSWPLLVGSPITVNENNLDGMIDTGWEVVEAIFTTIYCVEAALKLITVGQRKYFESSRNVFDFVITMCALFASAYVYYPNSFSDSRVIRYIVMGRVLRLVRIIISLKPFQQIGVIWYEIIPYATSVVCFLFFIMYIFAALGMELYGGMITRDPKNALSYLVLNTSFSENEYWANNMNDMISAFNVLFNLLVVNNWTICEQGYEAVTESKWVRFFFLAFNFFGVVIVNNLVIAFFINAFLQQKEILARRKDQLTVPGEAVIKGREARFDASHITGTRTRLVGAFIARIRSNCAEEDEQDRLKRLFTQKADHLRYERQEHDDNIMHFARS